MASLHSPERPKPSQRDFHSTSSALSDLVGGATNPEATPARISVVIGDPKSRMIVDCHEDTKITRRHQEFSA